MKKWCFLPKKSPVLNLHYDIIFLFLAMGFQEKNETIINNSYDVKSLIKNWKTQETLLNPKNTWETCLPTYTWSHWVLSVILSLSRNHLQIDFFYVNVEKPYI